MCIRDSAYAADNGDVYFSVRSDPSYGEVSGRNIDDLMVGARIEENEDCLLYTSRCV